MTTDVYYPQCWVRIQIRFEDYIKLPERPQPAIPNTDPVDAATQFAAIDKKIIPTQCQVTLNSYREADQCRVVIPYGALPVDPRWVRAATIQVFMGSQEPDVFADGMGQIGGEARITLIDETPDLQIEGSEVTNEIFRGFVDDWSVTQDGDDVVELEARDITQILIDAQLPIDPLSGIPKTLPLDEVIRLVVVGEPTAQALLRDQAEKRAERIEARRNQRRLQARINSLTAKQTKLTTLAAAEPANTAIAEELARVSAKLASLSGALGTATTVAQTADALPILAKRFGLPSMRGLVVTNNTGTPLPPLGQLKGASWYDSKGTAKRSKSGGAKEKISYWDFVTDLCVGLGYICYFRTPIDSAGFGQLPPAELVIDLPRTYYEESGQELRSFLYGFNVDSVSISRSFTGQNIPTGVVVSAIRASDGSPISARFPATSNVNRPGASATGQGDDAEYQTILLQDRIPGDNAEALLETMAQSLYEQLSRGEFKVDIKTTTLGAFGSNRGTGIADMFQLRAGDPVDVQLVPSLPEGDQPQVTQAGNFVALGLLERGRRLVDIGFSPVAAALAAVASESDQQQTTFRVKEVGVSFDSQSGFDFSIACINYLDARNAVRDEVVVTSVGDELVLEDV